MKIEFVEKAPEPIFTIENFKVGQLFTMVVSQEKTYMKTNDFADPEQSFTCNAICLNDGDLEAFSNEALVALDGKLQVSRKDT